MHAAPALQPAFEYDLDDDDDTVVVEPHEDLTVQVLLNDGFIHRKAADNVWETACDDPQRIDYRLLPSGRQRNERYDGRLCRGGCFSKSELAKSERKNAELAALPFQPLKERLP